MKLHVLLNQPFFSLRTFKLPHYDNESKVKYLSLFAFLRRLLFSPNDLGYSYTIKEKSFSLRFNFSSDDDITTLMDLINQQPELLQFMESFLLDLFKEQKLSSAEFFTNYAAHRDVAVLFVEFHRLLPHFQFQWISARLMSTFDYKGVIEYEA